MFYLFLAILCSSAIALIFKHSENRDMNRYAVTSTNYLTAFVVSFVLILHSGILSRGVNPFKANLSEEFRLVIFRNTGLFSAEASLFWAICVGILAGVFFFLSFIYYQCSVKEDGVGLAGTFSKLGILVPMGLSILLWRELPGAIQWIGIILSLASILIVNIPVKKMSNVQIRHTLILLFLFGGLAEFSNKIFQKYAIIDFKNVFLFFVFFVAFLISMYFTLRQGKKVTFHDLLIGICVGIPNLFSSFFLILALNTVPTTVAFPVYSASSIVLINLGGWVLYRERLSRKDTIAVVMTIIALVLINL